MYSNVLENLKYDEEKKTYSIVETGFRYEFPQSMYNDFRNYVFNYSLVSRWYKNLNNDDLSKVVRTSAY